MCLECSGRWLGRVETGNGQLETRQCHITRSMPGDSYLESFATVLLMTALKHARMRAGGQCHEMMHVWCCRLSSVSCMVDKRERALGRERAMRANYL